MNEEAELPQSFSKSQLQTQSDEGGVRTSRTLSTSESAYYSEDNLLKALDWSRLDRDRELGRLLNILYDDLIEHTGEHLSNIEETYQFIKREIEIEYKKTYFVGLNRDEFIVWHLSVFSSLDVFREFLKMEKYDSSDEIQSRFYKTWEEMYPNVLEKMSREEGTHNVLKKLSNELQIFQDIVDESDDKPFTFFVIWGKDFDEGTLQENILTHGEMSFPEERSGISIKQFTIPDELISSTIENRGYKERLSSDLFRESW